MISEEEERSRRSRALQGHSATIPTVEIRCGMVSKQDSGMQLSTTTAGHNSNSNGGPRQRGRDHKLSDDAASSLHHHEQKPKWRRALDKLLPPTKSSKLLLFVCYDDGRVRLEVHTWPGARPMMHTH